MPIPISDYRQPQWIRYEERYPWSDDKKDKFNEINPRHFAGRYRGGVGREGGWKQAGYNPNHDSTTLENLGDIRRDDITLKPY